MAKWVSSSTHSPLTPMPPVVNGFSNFWAQGTLGGNPGYHKQGSDERDPSCLVMADKLTGLFVDVLFLLEGT